MRVLHVISGLGRESGGPARSSQGLVLALTGAGVDAWMYSLDGTSPWIPGVRRYETNALSSLDVKGFDIVHIHGIWNPQLHKVCTLCRKSRVPYVVSPRGMLEPWSLRQKWFKKAIARFLYQDQDLRCAAALHATAESEALQFRKLGFRSDCIVSPNGVNVPETLLGHNPLGEGRRALFVSRMHAKKGVLELVESWARVKPMSWTCELVYTLNGDAERSYEMQVKNRVKELGLEDTFVFTGALDDEKKWEAYSRADLFVLPTYSENFGIVVAEALWAKVPVITTKGTPWSKVVENECGWWIDLPPRESLDVALRNATSHSACKLTEMGIKGRRLVEKEYSWQAACKSMVAGYNRLIARK